MHGLEPIAEAPADEFGGVDLSRPGPYHHGGHAYYFSLELTASAPAGYTWSIVTRKSETPPASADFTTWPLVSPPSVPSATSAMPAVANVSFEEDINGDTHLLYATFSVFDAGGSTTAKSWVYDFNANTWTSAAPSICS